MSRIRPTNVPFEELIRSTKLTNGVTGMTCGHCASAITEEFGKLPGVHEVSVNLVAGGTSAVHLLSDAKLDEAKIRDAVEEAGYELA
jgi:copper chaperone